MTKAESGAGLTTILVTGDLVVDHHIYIGERRSLSEKFRDKRATIEHVEFGGAALVERLLSTPPEESNQPWKVEFGLVKDQSRYPHCFATWEPHTDPEAPKERVWLAREAGYGPPPRICPLDDVSLIAGVKPANSKPSTGDAKRPSDAGADPELSPSAPQKARIVVVDDAGSGFRDRPTCWPDCLVKKSSTPPWAIWKMSGDLRGGPLWQEVRKNKEVVSQTILLVSASDLQRQGFDVAVGLSWERSALDVLHGLRTTTLTPLVECAHLVVSFPDSGVLWLDRSNPDTGEHVARLVYDSSGGAGVAIVPNRPKAFGYQACLTAGVTWCLASLLAAETDVTPVKQPLKPINLTDGLRRGLTARLRLFRRGHGKVEPGKDPKGFPADDIRIDALAPDPNPRTPFSDTTIPINAHRDWSIVQQGITAPGPFFDTAWIVARHGLSKLPAVPRLVVGAYATIERKEIEAIRRVRRCVDEYVARNPQKRPLSIAVFGAPGAGKSFIVEELATGLLGKKVPFIECNLSQFSDDRDLDGAFHLVRDAVLRGTTPVVFWDEFDSQEYRWLRLLLAPMQDGKFREGPIVHPIGKCIFVFAGGTSSTFDEFGSPEAGADAAEIARQGKVWRMSKGRDFKSRIHAHLNVLGRNPRPGRDEPSRPDPSDACFPIRRALFLRGKWELEKIEERKFSEQLVRGLLQVPEYRHGSRSFERVIVELAQDGFPIGPESLPTAEDLERDITEPEAVRRLLEFAHGDRDQGGVRELLRTSIEERIDEFAERINAAYMKHPKELRSSEVTLAYDNLSLFLRESNRAAVRRIGDVALAAGFRIVSADDSEALPREDALAQLEKRCAAGLDGRDPDVSGADLSRIDKAAEKEHEGWNKFHEERGWRRTKSQDIKKDVTSVPPLHPALIPWAELNEDNRKKDRDQVRIYMEIIYDLRFAVAPAGAR